MGRRRVLKATALCIAASFGIGDSVTWTDYDSDVPSGTIGKVSSGMCTDAGYNVHVTFPKGTWCFKTNQLVLQQKGTRAHHDTPRHATSRHATRHATPTQTLNITYMQNVVAIGACLDGSSSGYTHKINGIATPNILCSSEKAYCNHTKYGPTIRANCPKTCDACPLGA